MSNSATATAPAEPLHPDPDRAVSARLDSVGIGNILRLLRTLFAYGKNLVETLRQEDDPDDLPWYAFLTSIFRTTNPALITVTIIRGLLRAAALQARLSKSVAALLPFPLQDDRAAKRIDGERGPGLRNPRVAGWTIPPGWPAGEPPFDRQPTPEEEMFAEIVAEDRDRPIGPILLDICLDLGIVPALMDPAAWDELRLVITLYGGDPVPLVARSVDSAKPADLTGLAGAGRKSEAHPPWPASPEHPLPLRENRAAKRIDGGVARTRKASSGFNTEHGRDRPTASPAVLIRA